MTERLYYSDSFLYDFPARITELVETRDAQGTVHVGVVLDATAFYPTSGGQVFDTGTLQIGDAVLPVIEVAERDHDIVHLLGSTDARLTPGTMVTGRVDAQRRRDHMQQHSGQHVLSAAFVRLFNMPTVSFHMGVDSCTIDLDTPSVTAEQVVAAERLSNEVAASDRLVVMRFVTPDEARALGLRKIPPAERDKLRLIDIQDFDLCACGGTHVRSTGQIGAILLRKIEKVKQGMRVEFVCGDRAVATARHDFETLTEAGAVLSSHIWEVPQGIRKSQEESKSAAREQKRMLEELAELWAARLVAETPLENGRRVIVREFTDRDVAFVKLLAQKAIAPPGSSAVLLLASTSSQPTLIFAQSAGGTLDTGKLMKDVLARFGGRGGGNRELAQGGVPDKALVPEALKIAVELLQTQS